jgi:heme/copper-type cytochrome/quinol oxidase subunit 2
MDIKATIAYLEQKARDNRVTTILLAIIFLILIFFCVIFFFLRKPNNAVQSDQPSLQVLGTPQSTLVVVPTATPIPSNLWTVNYIYEAKETHFGFSSLVIEFKNTTSNEFKKGHCQSTIPPQ